jgi:hypothetical protein
VTPILSSQEPLDNLFPQSCSHSDRATLPRQVSGQPSRQWHTTEHAGNQSP